MNCLDLISVIIPFKEDRGYLNQAIESVNQQTYSNIELILSQGEGGVSENLNEGIKKSKGKYIKYLCDDDWLPPMSIELSLKEIQKGFDFIHGNATNFFSGSDMILQRPRKENPSLQDMLENNVIHGGSLMYDRKIFEDIGLFDEALTTGEEYELNLRALYHGKRLGYIDKNLYFYRRWENQKSLGKGVDQKKRKQIIDGIKLRYNS